jgi:phytoene/squalene synthetase
MREGEPPAAARDTGDQSPASGGGRDTGAPGPGDTPNTLSTSRYLAWLYSPAPQQHVLALLCEIENEIAGSLRSGVDHHVAHARLQWWREECERCAQGRPVHPLTRELAKAYGAIGAAPPAGIAGFVDAAVWDLASATFETRKELIAYCERWSAAMFETAAQSASAKSAHDAHAAPRAGAIVAARGSNPMASPTAAAEGQPARATIAVGHGPPNATDISAEPSMAARARGLGAAVRELELLENLAREAHAGRLRVPLDELERAGVDIHSLAKLPWPAALGTLLSRRHEALRAIIRDSIGALGREEQPRLRGLLVWAALASRQSMRVQRALPNADQPRRYDALADGWQAWQAARRATAGKLRLRGSPSG